VVATVCPGRLEVWAPHQTTKPLVANQGLFSESYLINHCCPVLARHGQRRERSHQPTERESVLLTESGNFLFLPGLASHNQHAKAAHQTEYDRTWLRHHRVVDIEVFLVDERCRSEFASCE
jgi:hypothetical protein